MTTPAVVPPESFTLVATVGLPRSGKSTWAKSTGLPIVNPDSIRLALHGQRFFGPAEPMVWAIAHLMVESLRLAGHPRVILDATNVQRKRREEWSCVYNVEYHLVPTPPEVCIERARAENDSEIIPVIERMAAQWDYPVRWVAAPAAEPPRQASADEYRAMDDAWLAGAFTAYRAHGMDVEAANAKAAWLRKQVASCRTDPLHLWDLDAPPVAEEANGEACPDHPDYPWQEGTPCPRCGGRRVWHDGMGSTTTDEHQKCLGCSWERYVDGIDS